MADGRRSHAQSLIRILLSVVVFVGATVEQGDSAMATRRTLGSFGEDSTRALSESSTVRALPRFLHGPSVGLGSQKDDDGLPMKFRLEARHRQRRQDGFGLRKMLRCFQSGREPSYGGREGSRAAQLQARATAQTPPLVKRPILCSEALFVINVPEERSVYIGRKPTKSGKLLGGRRLSVLFYEDQTSIERVLDRSRHGGETARRKWSKQERKEGRIIGTRREDPPDWKAMHVDVSAIPAPDEDSLEFIQLRLPLKESVMYKLVVLADRNTYFCDDTYFYSETPETLLQAKHGYELVSSTEDWKKTEQQSLAALGSPGDDALDGRITMNAADRGPEQVDNTYFWDFRYPHVNKPITFK